MLERKRLSVISDIVIIDEYGHDYMQESTDKSGQHYKADQLYLLITTSTGRHNNECQKGSTNQLCKVYQQRYC